MNIAIIGTGYVGLVQGVGMAEKGHKVFCVDIDKEKVKKMREGKSPIFEKGLGELMQKNIKAKRLFFTANLAKAIKDAEIIFIAVGTPQGESGKADLSHVYKVVRDVGKLLDHYVVIVNKSTVPVGTAKKVDEIIKKQYNKNIDVASNPEFLREGTALNDFFNPDRIVIGVETEKAKNIMAEVYKGFDCAKFFVSRESSEMIKYASNAFLATKISFINEIAGICERVNADIKEVAQGMGADARIGSKFLEAGLGYGGSCFPKDTRALHQIADLNGYEFRILKSVIDVNNNQKKILLEKIKKIFPVLKGKIITVWGLSFKPGTDDIRESQAIDLISWLYGQGAKVRVSDPVSIDNAKKYLPDEIEFFLCPYEASARSNAIIIVTDWEHFKKIDKQKIKKVLSNYYIIDGRNIFDPQEMSNLGFNYIGIGRGKD
ncbi:MAG: UDP-glucose/GDP-mannose dehydrogenase family protein [Patescibacteria group bacterium]|nr:UDP-glucose/GDP-mannose dehydrogenase family protein [Patescibacteria group bacterium]